MRTSIFSGTWFGLAAGVVVAGWALPATAAECADDSECPKGFTCEVSEVTACADAPACEPGTDCEAPPDCTVEEYRSCESIDCTADSDCADGMACETIQHETTCGTGGPTPEPDMDSEEPAPEGDPAPPDGSCEVEERNYCVPRYLLPCEAASDCGPGFTCEAREVCSCSSPPSSGSGTGGGSAGMPEDSDGDGTDPVPADDADDAERPAEPLPDAEDDGVDDGTDGESCVCEAGPVGCQLVVTECALNSDCPSGMTCEDNPEGVCSSSPDGTEECVADPEKICMPPYIDLIRGGGVDEAFEDGLDPQGQPAANPEESPSTPGESDDDSNEADADGSSSGGGCSVGAASAPTSAWAGLGLLLGAAVLGRRRRR